MRLSMWEREGRIKKGRGCRNKLKCWTMEMATMTTGSGGQLRDVPDTRTAPRPRHKEGMASRNLTLAFRLKAIFVPQKPQTCHRDQQDQAVPRSWIGSRPTKIALCLVGETMTATDQVTVEMPTMMARVIGGLTATRGATEELIPVVGRSLVRATEEGTIDKKCHTDMIRHTSLISSLTNLTCVDRSPR
jgi:hypothetical protein